MKWATKITKVEPNHLVIRGYRQEDLIGNKSFSEIVYLILKGELPSKEHGIMMDSILSACIDHGITPPSALAARIVASGGVPLPSAVAAGILSIGDSHGGAIEKGAKLLQEGVKRIKNEKLDINKIAEIIVDESKKNNNRILGFGHRIHTSDPRTLRLFNIADEMNIAGDHISLSKSIEYYLEKSLDKKLPINVDGAIAAIISDMGFDWKLGKAFFLIGRTVGLTAHVYEEQTDFKPMRKMFDVNCIYEGSEEKNLPII